MAERGLPLLSLPVVVPLATIEYTMFAVLSTSFAYTVVTVVPMGDAKYKYKQK